jgi:energy-coupling factor transporter ATP-binding protein EcfA2
MAVPEARLIHVIGPPPNACPTELLHGQELAYRYLDGRPGLAPLSFSVEAGESVLVSGPSGSGKSTLARCVTGLIPHLYRGELKGKVWLDGLLTTTTPLWQLAERAGLVFQNPAEQMLAQTVEEEIVFGLENLGLPAPAIKERLEAALLRFGLVDLHGRAPLTLSGGEQQKLALAAITARHPPLLVLDEPLSMLDATAAVELVAYLGEQAGQGTGLVICEHRREYLAQLGELRTLQLTGVGDHSPSAARPGLGGPPLLPESGLRLEVANLRVELGGRPVLRDLSTTFRGGEVTALVGRNGVGKTTLLRALTGLQPHEGTVRVRPAEPGQDGRPDLGLVFQNADLQLFNATLSEEILYRVPAPDRDFYAWLLEALGLTAYEQTPPLLLSEGEKKRLALATVLMRRPRHGLLLDEPALGQDSRHKEMLLRLLRSLAAAGRLVIMTTHDLTLAAQADRLLLLGSDGIVADGPPGEVLADRTAWASVGLVVPRWVCREPASGEDQRA